MITVKTAKTEQEIADCLFVRERVFVDEQNVPLDIEHDEHDKTALHFLALKDGKPSGAARAVLVDNDQTAMIGRVAVLKEDRGLGIGRLLMTAIEASPDLRNVKTFSLHAQSHALAFYLGLGYEPYGSEYDEAGIPHRSMRKQNITPRLAP